MMRRTGLAVFGTVVATTVGVAVWAIDTFNRMTGRKGHR